MHSPVALSIGKLTEPQGPNHDLIQSAERKLRMINRLMEELVDRKADQPNHPIVISYYKICKKESEVLNHRLHQFLNQARIQKDRINVARFCTRRGLPIKSTLTLLMDTDKLPRPFDLLRNSLELERDARKSIPVGPSEGISAMLGYLEKSVVTGNKPVLTIQRRSARIAEIMKAGGHIFPAHTYNPRGDYQSASRWQNQAIADFTRDFKRIPWVYAATKEEQRAWLRGYFTEENGLYVDPGSQNEHYFLQTSISMNKAELLTDVALTLARFGIFPRLTPSEKKFGSKSMRILLLTVDGECLDAVHAEASNTGIFSGTKFANERIAELGEYLEKRRVEMPLSNWPLKEFLQHMRSLAGYESRLTEGVSSVASDNWQRGVGPAQVNKFCLLVKLEAEKIYRGEHDDLKDEIVVVIQKIGFAQVMAYASSFGNREYLSEVLFQSFKLGFSWEAALRLRNSPDLKPADRDLAKQILSFSSRVFDNTMNESLFFSRYQELLKHFVEILRI